MNKIILIIFIIAFVISPLIRCFFFNLHNVGIYSVYDFFMYLYKRKWRIFNEYGIKMFVGMFGHGKTLSMTHKARLLYKQFGDSLLFISNYKLYDIPYVPLKNFNQLLSLGEKQDDFYTDDDIKNGLVPSYYYNDNNKIKKEYCVKCPCLIRYFDKVPFGDDIEINYDDYLRCLEDNSDTVYESCLFFDDLDSVPDDLKDLVDFRYRVKKPNYQGYVVLIDEIESVLSHRNYASFPLQLLSILCQQRKRRVLILCSSQRYFMVDKIFRGITTHVIDCNKYWRFQSMRYYDAWDYENAMTPQLVRPLGVNWWFVKNKDFNTYSTDQMITEDSCKDFISNDEKLARLGLDNVVNESAIQRPSRKLKRKIKGK